MHYGTPVDANNANNPSGYVHDGYWSNCYNNPNNNPNGYMPNVHDPNNPNNAHDYGHLSYGSSSHNNNNDGQNSANGHGPPGHGPNSHNNPNASQNDSGATTPGMLTVEQQTTAPRLTCYKSEEPEPKPASREQQPQPDKHGGNCGYCGCRGRNGSHHRALH